MRPFHRVPLSTRYVPRRVTGGVHFPQRTHNFRNPTYGRALPRRIGGWKKGVGLAAITLAAAIGFNVLALAIQDREH